MRFLAPVLRLFFHHFYRSLAWSYDLVSESVSLGRWRAWIRVGLRYVRGPRVLELGHGPGHLQAMLRELGMATTGLDESVQMGLMAWRRLQVFGYAHPELVRGRAQSLPFSSGAFDTLIATFPTDFIASAEALSSAQRVLRPGGRFVVLPAAWLAGVGWPDRIAAWLLRITGESPQARERFAEKIRLPFEAAGFRVTIEHVHERSSLVLVLLAEKPL
jgi:ubiquinone/menaquinone biosynthesis C-methylase UbiE